MGAEPPAEARRLQWYRLTGMVGELPSCAQGICRLRPRRPEERTGALGRSASAASGLDEAGPGPGRLRSLHPSLPCMHADDDDAWWPQGGTPCGVSSGSKVEGIGSRLGSLRLDVLRRGSSCMDLGMLRLDLPRLDLPRLDGMLRHPSFFKSACDREESWFWQRNQGGCSTCAPSEEEFACRSSHSPLESRTASVVAERRRLARGQSCGASSATSSQEFADPGQSLVFLDWDDTLFPTSDLFERCHLQRPGSPYAGPQPPQPPPWLGDELAAWRQAVREFLCFLSAHSDRCVIVTNSKRPWVSNCISWFAPELLCLLEEEGGHVRVVYASEAKGRRPRGVCLGGIRRLLFEPAPEEQAVEEVVRRLADEKLAAMRQEATAFYSRYEGQTWKNVLSIGDMPYEHSAVQELAASRKSPSGERLRTKALTLPSGPLLSDVTFRLRLLQLLVPALVRYDGDVDLGLDAGGDPLGAFGESLEMPQLELISMPPSAWDGKLRRLDADRGAAVSQEVEQVLDDVAVTVHDWLAQRPSA